MLSNASGLERFIISLTSLIKKYTNQNIDKTSLEDERKKILEEVKRFPELSNIVIDTVNIRANQGENDFRALLHRKHTWRHLNLSYFVPNNIYVFYKREGLYAYRIHSSRKIKIDSREITVYFLSVLYKVSPLCKISGFYYKDHILINYSGIIEDIKQIRREIRRPDEEFPQRSILFKKIFGNLKGREVFNRLMREYLYHEITHQSNVSLLSRWKGEGYTPIPPTELVPDGDFYWRVIDEVGAYLGQIAISANPKFVIVTSLLPNIHSWSPSIEYGDTSRIIIHHLFNKFKKYSWFESSYLSDIEFIDSLSDEQIRNAARELFEETFKRPLPKRDLLEEAMKKTIYTIGSSTRDAQEFLEILKHYDIRCLIDVRSFPTSKFEHFKKERLKELLEGEGIRYIYLGKELGGYRRGGYEVYMKTNNYLKGIKRLEKIAERNSSAIMCAERFPWRCHRRFISQSLRERKWEVIHILEKDRIWQGKNY